MNAEDSHTGSGFNYWTWWLPAFAALWLTVVFTLAENPLELIQRNWPFVLVGFSGAFVGNISAIGGGIVFIPVMIFAYHISPLLALKTSLATQSFGMTSGAIGWLHKGVVPLKALAFTVPGLLLGSTISSLVIHPNGLLVKLVFGPVSILLGVLTLLSAKEQKGPGIREIPRNAILPVFVASMIGGLLTGWVAVGEGEIVAAVLMLVYRMDAAASIGLGVLLLAINSIYLALIHSFVLGGVPWEIAGFTILGAVFGARFAPFVAHRFKQHWLKRLFATIAIADGAAFIIQYILMQSKH